MNPIQKDEIQKLDIEGFHERLEPVYETVRRLRAQLPAETALIGFCGAPWTVATYMIAGHGTTDQAPARLFAYRYPDEFRRLLNLLADISAEYLISQARAGAEVVQIFDSWAGILEERLFKKVAIDPVARMVSQIRREMPDLPIIGFPKGAGCNYDHYRTLTGVTALGLDWMVPMAQAKRLQQHGPVQGNLDPMRLVAGGDALETGTRQILEELGGGALVFNLGHGVVPETPLGHVERMLEIVRNGR